MKTFARIAVLALVVTGCGEPELVLKLNPSAPEVQVGEFVEVTLEANTGQIDTVAWSVADPRILAVEGDQATVKLRGMVEGKTKVFAKLRGKTAEAEVTIRPAKLQSLKLPPDFSMAKGTVRSLSAIGTYSDGSTADLSSKVTWSSSTLTEGSVDASGLVKAILVGNFRVTATHEGVSAQVQITVTPAELFSITLTPAMPTLAAGTQLQLVAQGNYSDGTMAPVTSMVTWESGDSTIATVSAAGRVSGLKAGTVEIAALRGLILARTTVKVTGAFLTGLTVTPANASVVKGLTQQLTATGTFGDGTMQNLSTTVTWSVADAGVATVDSAGLATGVEVGSTQVSAFHMGIVASANLNVVAPALTGVTVTPANATVPKGVLQPYTATGAFTDNTTRNVTAMAAWSTADAGVATISASGVLEAIEVGATAVRATVGGFTGSTAVTVGQAQLNSIAIDAGVGPLPKGASRQLEAIGAFSDGTFSPVTAQVTWSTADAGVATISAGGLASGTGVGTTEVRASLGTVLATASLTVGPPALVSIAVNPPNPTVARGRSQSFSAIGTWTDADSGVLTDVSWDSLDASVATISDAGVAYALAEGVTLVRATRGSVSGGTSITVTAAAIDRIEIAPVFTSLAKGRSRQLTATATFSDDAGLDITGTALWSSSDEGKLTVDAGFLFAASAGGPVGITASQGGAAKTVQITVDPAALDSIRVTPHNLVMQTSTSRQYLATGTFSDGTTSNLTGTATWSSDNTNAATVDATGFVTAAGDNQTANIRAQSGTIFGQTMVSVTASTLMSISVTPPLPSVQVGQTTQLTATGTYADLTMRDLTTTCNWATQDSNIATIGLNTGLAKGVDAGSTGITATLGSVNGGATLTVTP